MSNQLDGRAGAKSHTHPSCPSLQALGSTGKRQRWPGSKAVRPKEAGIFFLQIQPIFSPSSPLKSRAELFFLVVSCSDVESRRSAAFQKEEEVLVSSFSLPQDLLTHLGGFFLNGLTFFLLSALTQQSSGLLLSPSKPQPSEEAAISSFTALTQHF